MNGTELREVPGMCGVVDGGIVDGLWGYEAGQSGVGDIFGWFTKNGVPPGIPPGRGGRRPGHPRIPHRTRLQPGDRGTRPDRARLALGKPLRAGGPRTLRRGCRTDAGHPPGGHLPGAAGGHGLRHPHHRGRLPRLGGAGEGIHRRRRAAEEQAPDADLRRHHRVCSSPPSARRRGRPWARPSTPPSPPESTRTSGRPRPRWAPRRAPSTRPIPENVAAYDELFQEYRTLHDYFGRGANEVMHRLKAIQRSAVPAPRRQGPPRRRSAGMSALLESIARIRREVCGLHAELPRYGLVVWTAGNVSARVPGDDLLVIKPSGRHLRRADPGSHGGLRPRRHPVHRARRRARRRGNPDLVAVLGHRRARLRLPAHAGRRRRRAHPLHLRDGLGRARASRCRAC